MEAVRTRRFPKFANGGQAKWMFDTKMPNALTPVEKYLATPPGGVGPSGGKGISGIVSGGGASGKALIDFGHYLQALGYSVTEHPAFGGVHGGHAKNSFHYRGRAIDVNRGAGTSRKEQRYLAAIVPEAHRRGLRSIFMAPYHYNHAHFDTGRADGGLIRKYDTGGVLPPGYSLAFNGTGQNETVRTQQQEQALAAGATRLDRRDLALLAQYMASATGGSAITMDGRKVAETTNRYNYLPTGV
jgi:hypothetical protein